MTELAQMIEELAAAAAVGEIRLTEWEESFVLDMQDLDDCVIEPGEDCFTDEQEAKIREMWRVKIGGRA